MKKLNKYVLKYKDVIPYLFFGVCTTLVNVVVYWGCAHLLCFGTMVSTIIAWVMAVLFAYITNRKWVFKSLAKTKIEIAREIISFFGCRIATGVVDWLCMLLFVEILKLNDVVIKVLANILVVILNYIASKLIIFRGSEK